MRVLVCVAVILSSIVSFPPSERSCAKAYDVCVLERLEVTRIYGSVAAAEDGSGFRGAEVALIDRESLEEVTRVETEPDGSFSLGSTPSGGYWLRASYPGRKTLSVAVDVDRNIPQCPSSTEGVAFHLGRDFDDGAFVTTTTLTTSIARPPSAPVLRAP